MRAGAEYFDTNGFIRTYPPILTLRSMRKAPPRSSPWTTSATRPITQSGQLYIESTALALGKV